MTKIVGIGGGKKTPEKPPESCDHCGASPACPGITCPRIKRYWADPSGAWEVTYHKTWTPTNIPPEPPPVGDETP
jgi:hypothetical protein